MRASAPCKVILFGEHAVVYDKLGIATAIDQRTFADVSQNNDGIELVRTLDPKHTKISKEELFDKLDSFRRLYERRDFPEIQKFSFVDSLLIVIAENMRRFGYRDVRVEISFENALKGIGRSSSKCAAITMAMANFLGHSVSNDEIREIAYLGDVVAHAGIPSGIDTSTVTFGGYISYRKSEGVKPVRINYELPLLLVDSGEPARTSYTVAMVRKRREEEPESIDKILEEIDSVSHRAVTLLEKRDLKKLGELMNRNHELLKELGVSTPKLNAIAETALEDNALGAKMTAGGGGGCCIILARDQKQAEDLTEIYKNDGFNSFQSKIGVEGVRIV